MLRLLLALAATVVLGLASRLHPLGWFLYDRVLGEVLYAVAAYLVLAMLLVRRPPWLIAGVAFGCCLAVELFKLTGIPAENQRVFLVKVVSGDDLCLGESRLLFRRRGADRTCGLCDPWCEASREPPNHPLQPTGAAVRLSRGVKSPQAAPAAERGVRPQRVHGGPTADLDAGHRYQRPDPPGRGHGRGAGLARKLERGVLNASAGNGRSLQLRFDPTRSFMLYMGPDRVILRPHFPVRPDVGPEIQEMFCPCCGILLRHWDDLLPLGMSRGEGFRLFEAILIGGELPSSVPVEVSDQPPLPGMESFAVIEPERRLIEWRPFGINDRGPAEPAAAANRGRS